MPSACTHPTCIKPFMCASRSSMLHERESCMLRDQFHGWHTEWSFDAVLAWPNRRKGSLRSRRKAGGGNWLAKLVPATGQKKENKAAFQGDSSFKRVLCSRNSEIQSGRTTVEVTVTVHTMHGANLVSPTHNDADVKSDLGR